MKFFDGLFPYEIILLVLGGLLFLVIIVAFVVLVIRGKPYGKLLMFFAIPIIMIGFPGVKSFEISASVIKIEKATRALEEDPTDKDLRASLEKEVTNVSSRPIGNPRVSTTIARAQVALGNDVAAEARIGKALKVAPKLSTALELKKRLDLDRNLADLTSKVEQNPGDTGAKTKLETTVKELDRFRIASPETVTNVARAHSVLGDQAKAKENLEKALTIKPNLAPAIRLNEQIKVNAIPVRPPRQ